MRWNMGKNEWSTYWKGEIADGEEKEIYNKDKNLAKREYWEAANGGISKMAQLRILEYKYNIFKGRGGTASNI